jgi:hypothetical protein
MKGWIFPPATSTSRREATARIFGKAVVKFTTSRMITDYGDLLISAWYKVLGKDSNSVAIFVWDDDGPRAGDIVHIHFVKDHYWVPIVNGPNVEWFKRVPAKKPKPRSKRTAQSRRR